MEQFKKKNPNYFKDYYRKNIDKFKQRNKDRPSTRSIFYKIEINGTTYYYDSIKSMNIKNVKKDEIAGKKCKYIKNNKIINK